MYKYVSHLVETFESDQMHSNMTLTWITSHFLIGDAYQMPNEVLNAYKGRYHKPGRKKSSMK